MSDLSLSPPLPRAELLTELRGELHRPPLSLSVLASQVCGLEDGIIDWIAVGPDRRLVLGFLADPGDDLPVTAHALAQRPWAERRVHDWQQLAPDLHLEPGSGVRLLILAPEFGERTRSLARAVAPESIQLVRVRCIRDGARVTALLDPLAPCARPTSEASPRSRFRTGLSDDELGLSPAERKEFE